MPTQTGYIGVWLYIQVWEETKCILKDGLGGQNSIQQMIRATNPTPYQTMAVVCWISSEGRESKV